MRVAVIVPGIMGSILHITDDATGAETELWGGNFRENYLRLIDDPDAFGLDRRVSRASLLENVYVSGLPKLSGLTKWQIWRRTLEWLGRHPEFSPPGRIMKFGYDWRRSLVDTSREFADELKARTAAFAAAQKIGQNAVKFVFITHSMGGLLVRCALAQKKIQAGQIDRIINVGAPLEGAPHAFGSAYKTGSLPALRQVIWWFHGFKNTDKFMRRILELMQTLPSAYQLMPPVGHDYLHYSTGLSTNPFVDPSSQIPNGMKVAAAQAHQLLTAADQVLHGSGLSQRTYTVYSEWLAHDTDSAFRVISGANWPGGYKISETYRTAYGDGTVPALSARGRLGYSIRKPVSDVRHMTMCDNQDVVALMPGMV